MSIIMRVILVIMQIAICIVSKNCNFRAMVLFSSNENAKDCATCFSNVVEAKRERLDSLNDSKE